MMYLLLVFPVLVLFMGAISRSGKLTDTDAACLTVDLELDHARISPGRDRSRRRPGSRSRVRPLASHPASSPTAVPSCWRADAAVPQTPSTGPVTPSGVAGLLVTGVSPAAGGTDDGIPLVAAH